MKRSAIVSELRSTATETQKPILTWLAEQKKAGKVSDYQSYYIVNAISVTGTKDVMEDLAKWGTVEKILPNEKRQIIAPQKKQNTRNVKPESTTEWNIDRVNVPQLWEEGIDGSGVVIANIDTGVQWDHPALKDKYRGYDPATGEVDHTFNWYDPTTGQAVPYDDLAHGTHTMGTMVGSESGGNNRIGVAPGAKWIAVKAFSAAGGTDADLLAAGEWILAPKDAEGNPHPEKAPDVVNNSWGGGPGLDEWYRPMVEVWRSAEIFPEFSAGNDGGSKETVANPANYPESFATGATDIEDKIAGFSSKGPSPYDEVKPEISAPGVDIRSSVPGDGYEGGWEGTSMAGPHVSAIAALLKQVDAGLTVTEIETILTSTAKPLFDSKYQGTPNNGYGYGLVDAKAAVEAIRTGLGEMNGQVLTAGEDTKVPTFKHESPAFAYKKANLPLVVQVEDNVSITGVDLFYRTAVDAEWKIITAEQVAGNYRTGDYQATIPGQELVQSNLTYYWKVKDYGENIVTSDSYDLELREGISHGYEEDFETYPTGWLSYGAQNSWEWGVPTSGPESAASGEKVFATNLAGNYANSANMNLIMPPIDLPEGETYLQFKQWYALEEGFDYGQLYISTDQRNWTSLATYNGASNGWIDEQIALSEYAGQRVYLNFNVISDPIVSQTGWYIDNMRLSGDMGEAKSASKKNQILPKPPKQAKKNVRKIIDPKTLKPSKKEKIVSANVKPTPSTLPVAAQVNVLETGRATTVNPVDGSYSLIHTVGDFTVQAEAYGYHSKAHQVQVMRDTTTTQNFILDPIAQGTVSGQIKDEKSGKPIQGATLYLVEDAVVKPVQSDENGNYSIQAYEGTYTLKVGAPHYFGQEATIEIKGNETITQNFDLKPFISYPGEIGYDDGTADGFVTYDAGTQFAVKMSLADGKDRALLQSALIHFFSGELAPEETDFQVAIYDASGPEGSPGKRLVGPIDAAVEQFGKWQKIDLADKSILVEGDFYVVYIQKDVYPDTPGLSVDHSYPNSQRNWLNWGGTWEKAPVIEGNFMIRAQVDYEAVAPVIESPKNDSFVNQKTITVSGQASPSTTVKLYNKGKEIAETKATAEGIFSTEVNLKKGKNVLTAISVTDIGDTNPSAKVNVTLDRKKPGLTITAPLDGTKTNKEVITVTGQATDDYLAHVKVNGKKATLKDDGSFTYRLLLNEGENKIDVSAIDKAGNKTKKSVNVFAKTTVPQIKNLKPNQDVHLKSGESVKIELNSEAKLKASYIIRMPLANPVRSMKASSITEFPMMEDGAGHYTAYYTATSNLRDMKGAVIEVILRDAFGNEVREEATGKLFINVKE
ncbi:S8 family serine peptidase [Polycladospora coralii]|uniref:S8 family serine peptidase n=1 Tax=Polycladospora coralii TaxID=2771432 RepID=UPI0020C01B9D|nr:S8 family serine peptidase [Polycladospora coralii]